LVSCWARTRYIPDPWPASSPYWNEIEEYDNNDNELLERALPLMFKSKKSFRNGYHSGDEERKKKYLGESSHYQGGGHNLQGLWAMPGRR